MNHNNYKLMLDPGYRSYTHRDTMQSKSSSSFSSNKSSTKRSPTSSFSNVSSYFSDDSEISLGFEQTDPIYEWKAMLECDEFVGYRRSKHTAVDYKDAIYFFGGDNTRTMLNDIIRFDCREKSWGRAFTIGSPPEARYHHTAVVYGSSMLVFGGYTGDIHSNLNLRNKNDLFEYKFPTGQWIEWKIQGVIIPPRSAHGAAVYDDKMWVYAGYDGNTRLNDMWSIQLNGDVHKWEEIIQTGDQPPTCCNFPVTVARDCMYVFSGQSGAAITNHLYEFNFRTHNWRRISEEFTLRDIPTPPLRRYGHTMVHHHRFLYVFGGSADKALEKDVHRYDLDTNVWKTIKTDTSKIIPFSHTFHSATIVDDAMYVYGGTIDYKERSGSLFKFQLPTYPKCTLADDFGKFLSERQFCDVQFIVGEHQIRISAHIAIVAARSPLLKSKILTAREEMNKHLNKLFGKTEVPAVDCPILEVVLSNTSPNAFELVLSYIYTDRIDFQKTTSNEELIFLVLDIYQLAVEFFMPRLEQLCIRYLVSRITKENVLDALFNANKLNLSMIKDYCYELIVKEENFAEIVSSSKFDNLEKSLMVEIIRRRVTDGQTGKPLDFKYNELIGTTLQSDMCEFLLKTGRQFCDINLVLENNMVISAHKSILAARSSYFQALFRSFSPPDNNVNIRILDVAPSPEALKSLLRYIYFGGVKMAPEDCLYIFQAPSFYGFTNNRLQEFCKHILENNITTSNVLEILEAADKVNVPDVKNYALKLIVREFSQIANLPKMRSLNRELLLDILDAIANFLGKVRMPQDLISLGANNDI